MSPIGVAELPASEAATSSYGSSAPALSDRVVMLRFRLVSADARSLEALRYARRAMLREEGTRGLEEGEPSLGDAVFTASDVSWSVPAAAAGASRSKLEELIARANRALDEIPAHRPDPARPGPPRP
jgi:hypothetical protein